MNLKKPFFHLKTNKSPGYDAQNVIKNYFSELNFPLKYLFGKPIEKGVFPNVLKIARVTPLFKGGGPSDSVTIDPSPFFPVSLKIWSV